MPLTQRQVDAIRPTGKPFKRYDRDGLMVRVTAAGKARWVWRGVVKGKRIEVGMGSTRFRSLKVAREVAFEHTRTARLGGDPRAPVASDAPTFREAATLYLEIQSPDWGEEHSRHVRRLLEQHAFPGLGDLPVNEIQTADLMRVLVPLWRRQRPTGQRLRQRIAGVMAWSVAAGYRADDPTSTLTAVLPAGRRKRKHHRYLPAEELREALAKVQASGAWIGTRLALRFLALTAARSGEVRGARWREVDQESATWTVPASRMKSRKEHRVPLSSAALVVLKRADRLRGRGGGLVFPGIQRKMVGAAVFGRLLNDLGIDCSPHGFRSSFRSWCSDEGIDRELAEQALAHAVGSQVEQVLRPQRRAGASARGHGGLGSVPGPVAGGHARHGHPPHLHSGRPGRGLLTMALKPPEVPHLAGRFAALREFGFRPHEAAWLTLVCLHSGVFTRTQFTEHHRCHRKKTSRFLRALTERGFAREHPVPGVGTRLRYTHVHSRRLYSALGVEDTRHRRKPEEDVVLFRRLLCLDHVVHHPRLPWLATEAEKVAHFEARGIPRNHYPSRIYGGAAKRTRRYFPLRLPIAADLRSATFVYADPGRHTDTELRSWAAGHRHLWAWLRVFGTEVRVAVVTRTVLKQHKLSRRVAAWADSPPVRPLTPEEWQTVVAIRAALLSADSAALEQWGGFHAARRVLIRLRQRGDPEAAGGTSGPPIDGYSTHHARGLAPQGLA